MADSRDVEKNNNLLDTSKNHSSVQKSSKYSSNT